MQFEVSKTLGEIAVGLGLATILWATIVAGIEKKKLQRIAPQPRGWSESFVQATSRYLSKKQKIVFFGCMGSVVVLAIASYLMS